MTLLAAALDLAAHGCSVIPVVTDGTEEIEPALWQRFSAKVAIAPSGCWIWTASKTTSGYGKFTLPGRQTAVAHRVLWEWAHGAIAPGLQLDHLCRVRACVRPLHLEPVDCRTNLLRGTTLAAANAAKTHCPHGHPYDEENTYLKRGHRVCRACNRIDCARRRSAA